MPEALFVDDPARQLALAVGPTAGLRPLATSDLMTGFLVLRTGCLVGMAMELATVS